MQLEDGFYDTAIGLGVITGSKLAIVPNVPYSPASSQLRGGRSQSGLFRRLSPRTPSAPCGGTPLSRR